MRNRLGRPAGPFQSAQASGQDVGFRLYSRVCQGGIAYLNWTGATKNVTLPAGTWYDRNGNQVTTLSITDMAGDYVVSSASARVSWPWINPRRAGTVTGPLKIGLSIDAHFGTGATIHYTTDGTDPTESSPTYTDSITLSQSAVVKACAYKSGMLSSFVNTASYSITATSPTVQFHLQGDTGSEFLGYDYPLVELSNPSGKVVTVHYAVTGGTATAGADYQTTSGTLTFAPGEGYAYFPLHIIDDTQAEPLETIVMTLSSPSNASLGSRTAYTYTIQDNDGGATVMEPLRAPLSIERRSGKAVELFSTAGRRVAASAPRGLSRGAGIILQRQEASGRVVMQAVVR
jgi:hypothetical protein